MSTPAAPLHFVPSLPAEEAARAEFYALLARLFCAPPDEALLRSLAAAGKLEAEEGGLASAWEQLRAAAAQARPAQVREEYDSLFIGTGKAPVTLYTCAYSIRYASEAPLAALRGELAALGLARRTEANEPEDHIGALCETMRYLVAERKAGLPEQRKFFEQWIWPTTPALCSAIKSAGSADFYKPVAQLLFELCTLEHMAFEML